MMLAPRGAPPEVHALTELRSNPLTVGRGENQHRK